MKKLKHLFNNNKKPDTNNQTLPCGVLTIKKRQEKYNIQSDIKTLLRRDCEVEKLMRYLKYIGVFEEI